MSLLTSIQIKPTLHSFVSITYEGFSYLQFHQLSFYLWRFP